MILEHGPHVVVPRQHPRTERLAEEDRGLGPAAGEECLPLGVPGTGEQRVEAGGRSRVSTRAIGRSTLLGSDRDRQDEGARARGVVEHLLRRRDRRPPARRGRARCRCSGSGRSAGSCSS